MSILQGSEESHAIQLPQDLIGVIATAVMTPLTDDFDNRARSRALKSCMLVSRSFACEFRPFLYETFTIGDGATTGECVLAYDRLDTRLEVLNEHPEYRKLVKNVKIIISPKNLTPSMAGIINSARFPSWMMGLQSVTTILIRSVTHEPFDFSKILQRSQEAIVELCSLPSVKYLALWNILNLPPYLLNCAPKVKRLSLWRVLVNKDTTVSNLSGDEEVQSPNLSLLHLNLRGHFPIREYPNVEEPSVWALEPILKRVWKLSGQYGQEIEAQALDWCTIRVEKTVRELDFRIRCDPRPSGIGPQRPIFMPANISCTLSLERLKLTFVPEKEWLKDISEVLRSVWDMFSTIQRTRSTALAKLSHLTLEILDIHLLDREAIQNEEMWKPLEEVFADRAFLPHLANMTMKLHFRACGLTEEEGHFLASLLLPSLPDDVKKVFIYLNPL
ncbi:hypothetical protein BKA70DRAFT_1313839 [Coprinopsis sp. MPI-PUGE-AT-0042]|nr:hypothetical protein BKA70DRAFT_1313839 [Coprinopsis sp. MPI-PUGE-AT-0042]